jgi:hypothetical protein
MVDGSQWMMEVDVLLVFENALVLLSEQIMACR